MQIQLVWCIMAMLLIFEIPNRARVVFAWDLMWKPYLEKVMSPLLILSSSKSENVWTSQRNVLGIQHQDPHQCERFPACGSRSAGLHAPRPRQCAALFTDLVLIWSSLYVNCRPWAENISGIPSGYFVFYSSCILYQGVISWQNADVNMYIIELNVRSQ